VQQFALSPAVELVAGFDSASTMDTVFSHHHHSADCRPSFQPFFSLMTGAHLSQQHIMHKMQRYEKQSAHTFMPPTADHRYCRAGRMQRQTCTAAVHRKKRSMRMCAQPILSFKEYSDTGAESMATCSAATDGGVKAYKEHIRKFRER
jgi:hypothetical protein